MKMRLVSGERLNEQSKALVLVRERAWGSLLVEEPRLLHLLKLVLLQKLEWQRETRFLEKRSRNQRKISQHASRSLN
jgi:hypothetical protein